MKPTLYILIGIPGCGKSTFADHIQNGINTVWIARDKIRFKIVKEDEEYFSHESEVFQKFVDNIVFSLKDGLNVIADATHINMSSRRKLIYAIDKKFNNYKIIYVIFDISFDICLARNNAREGRACVPEQVMKNMYKDFRIPRDDEDNRAIGSIIIKGAFM